MDDSVLPNNDFVRVSVSKDDYDTFALHPDQNLI